jgi:hypothetical protein
MTKRKKPKRFSAVTQVKALAREAVGLPPPTRPAPDPRTKAKRKAEKHKPKLEELATEE